MRKLETTLVALLLSSAASFSWAECDRPERPAVPNGSEATMDDMVAGQTAVKAYVADGDAYIKCLEAEENSAMSDVDSSDENAVAAAEAANAERIKTHNEVVDEMTTVAGEWKESMTAFKSKDS
ncbi:MAG: hypothetical protein AB8B48_07925 [Pseudomonadales bacterium]